MANKTMLKVKVRDTENIIFEGETDRISSYNEIGPFDVYPMHANFISILKKRLTLYDNRKKIKELEFEQAVMKVKKDLASIFLGIDVLFVEEQSSSKQSSEKSNK